jgi:hypothetical protein
MPGRVAGRCERDYWPLVRWQVRLVAAMQLRLAPHGLDGPNARDLSPGQVDGGSSDWSS